MKTRFLVAAALFALGAIAHAQQLPPGKWWQRPEIVQELQLTNEQQQRLDQVFREAANDLIDAKAAVEKLQIAIRGELDRPQVRREELQRIASQLSNARGRLFERELMMLVDMRGVLTEQQWMRVRSFLDRMHQQRGNPPRPHRRPPPRGRRP